MTPFADELVVDNFAGGGGAGTGIAEAIGRSADIAINHSKEAVALYRKNHPETRCLTEDLWDVDPIEVCAGRPVGLGWFSPDCTHFSKAKGAKPVSKKIRGLAYVILRWAVLKRPRMITMENVEEFKTWGPLLDNHRPDPRRRAETFDAFVAMLTTGIDPMHPVLAEVREFLGPDFPLEPLIRGLGYAVEWRALVAADFGAPTTRKRLFLIARCDGLPIRWPTATHGRGRAKPWRPASECIDWSIPCPSIFLAPDEAKAIGVKRPLADNTLRRIGRGIDRFVINAAEPFIVPTTHHGDSRIHSLREPLRTVTGAHRGEFALVAPTLIQTGYGERDGQAPRVPGLDKPLGTVVAGGCKHALVAAFLAKHYGGHESPGASLELPLSTVTTQDHHHLVTAHIQRDFGQSVGSAMTAPMPTITGGANGHAALVRAFLVAYYGNEREGVSLFEPMRTVTARDRLGLVTVQGQDYLIGDIGMRMLVPRELFNAQGFPRLFHITAEVNGKPLTKTAQVKLCGNSVPPPMSRAIISANIVAPVEREGLVA